MERSEPVQLAEGPLVVGVDVGGTKIAAAVVDRAGRIYGRVQHPTDLASPAMTLRSIAGAVESAVEAAGAHRTDITGVGLGIPGKVDPKTGAGLVSVNLGWRDVPVTPVLEASLGIRCAIENDVRAAALGESYYGAGRKARNMVYLSLGTGIAAGFILDGKLYRGTTGFAGEIGHAIVQPDGPVCKCGARGCLEVLAAGPAIAARARAAIEAGGETALRDAAGDWDRLTSEQVCQAAVQGDPLAQTILREVGGYIAYGIHLLAMFLDPELIVLGGGVGLAGNVLLNAVQEHAERLAAEAPMFAEVYQPGMLELTALGRDVAILGAAALAAPTPRPDPAA